jgi:hypothetical protein
MDQRIALAEMLMYIDCIFYIICIYIDMNTEKSISTKSISQLFYHIHHYLYFIIIFFITCYIAYIQHLDNLFD